MTRRGLTLIEVVAATVLLSMLAVAVVPVLRDARTQVESRASRESLFELGLLADVLLEDPTSAGAPAEWLDDIAGKPEMLTVSGRPILVRREGEWVVFERGASSVARYMPFKQEEEGVR